MNDKILILNNDERDVLNIKYPLIRTLTKNINTLVFAVPPHEEVDAKDYTEKFPDKDVVVRHVPINLYSFNPLRDLRYVFSIVKLIREEKPAEIFTMSIKPIAAVGIALRLTGEKTKAVALFSGLGRAFLTDGFLSKLKVHYAETILRGVLKSYYKAVFQNQDNLDYFVSHKIIRPDQGFKTNGTGIDLNEFRPSGRRREKLTSVIMISRIIRSKGIHDYCKAAHALKAKYPEVNFFLAGPLEDTANGIPEADLGKICGTAVTYKGFIKDIQGELEQHDLFVLPTKYPEGVPRIILEAIAMGIPVITTNTAGCNEAVENGVNGFLLETGNADEITKRLEELIHTPERLNDMGEMARVIAEQKFNIDDVNRSVELIFNREA